LAASPARADDNYYDDDNLFSIEACESPDSSSFNFHIYYNSGLNGAWRNIGYHVYNFDVLRPGGSSHDTYPLRFCSEGASSPWPGSGQHIKNNAASGENTHYKYKAHVYYNSGYKGVQDVMDPYQHHDRFINVYNENASFQWTS
jgi:hypothetical protein